MNTHFEFDPDQVAYYEAHSWHAYYDRDWLRLLRLILALCQAQFHIPFPVSLLAAYYMTRAAAAWAPVDHDMVKAQMFYERFYRIAQRYSGLQYDPARVGALELQYKETHRRLSRKADKTEFIHTMIELHSTIFGITPMEARESAELRVQANNVYDLIRNRTSTDPEADWIMVEEQLRECYRSIQRALNAQ